MRGQSVKGQCCQQAEHGTVPLFGDRDEVRLAGWRQAAQTEQTARDLFDFACVAQRVERARVNASAQRFEGAQRPVARSEHTPGCLDRGLHRG